MENTEKIVSEQANKFVLGVMVHYFSNYLWLPWVGESEWGLVDYKDKTDRANKVYWVKMVFGLRKSETEHVHIYDMKLERTKSGSKFFFEFGYGLIGESNTQLTITRSKVELVSRAPYTFSHETGKELLYKIADRGPQSPLIRQYLIEALLFVLDPKEHKELRTYIKRLLKVDEKDLAQCKHEIFKYANLKHELEILEKSKEKNDNL